MGTVYFYHTVVRYDHPRGVTLPANHADNDRDDNEPELVDVFPPCPHPSLVFMALLPYSRGNGYKVGDVVSLISSFVMNKKWINLSLNKCYDDSKVVDLFTTLAVIMQNCDKEITTGANFIAKVLGLGLGDDVVTLRPFYPMKLNVQDCCDKFRALSGYGVYNPDYEIACWAARSRN